MEVYRSRDEAALIDHGLKAAELCQADMKKIDGKTS